MCLCTSLDKVLSHLLPQCKTLHFAFQFLVYSLSKVEDRLLKIWIVTSQENCLILIRHIAFYAGRTLLHN